MKEPENKATFVNVLYKQKKFANSGYTSYMSLYEMFYIENSLIFKIIKFLDTINEIISKCILSEAKCLTLL